MNNQKLFLDTCALMNHVGGLADTPIIISSVTVQQLNNIKENRSKTEDVRFKSRMAARFVDKHPELVTVWQYLSSDTDEIAKLGLEDIPDYRIVAGAFRYTRDVGPVVFWTEDTLCRIAARDIWKLPLYQYSPPTDYTGWVDRTLDDEAMSEIYSNPSNNFLDLLTNEYAIIRTEAGEQADVIKWDGQNYVRVKPTKLKSIQLGDIRPYHGDPFQMMAMDSMESNQLTMLRGPAGVGKSLLALGYLFMALEKHKIDKIVIFCNPVAVWNAAKLGLA